MRSFPIKLPDSLKEKPARSLVLLSGVASASFLVAALIGQYGFDLHPCELCIAQRIPYITILLVSVFACSVDKPAQVMEKVVLLCAVLFFIDGLIAIYHSGVELGILHGPSSCTNSDKPGATIEEMLAAIKSAQLVPCDQPMAYFIGLSMASWNAIAAMSSAIFVFVMLKKNRNGVRV